MPSHLGQHLFIRHCGCHSCSLRYASETNMNFLFLLHNFMDRRFVLTAELSKLSIWFFSFLIKSRPFTFSLKGSNLWLLFGVSELPASLLLHLGATVEWDKGDRNTSTLIVWCCQITLMMTWLLRRLVSD